MTPQTQPQESLAPFIQMVDLVFFWIYLLVIHYLLVVILQHLTLQR